MLQAFPNQRAEFLTAAAAHGERTLYYFLDTYSTSQFEQTLPRVWMILLYRRGPERREYFLSWLGDKKPNVGNERIDQASHSLYFASRLSLRDTVFIYSHSSNDIEQLVNLLDRLQEILPASCLHYPQFFTYETLICLPRETRVRLRLAVLAPFLRSWFQRFAPQTLSLIETKPSIRRYVHHLPSGNPRKMYCDYRVDENGNQSQEIVAIHIEDPPQAGFVTYKPIS